MTRDGLILGAAQRAITRGVMSHPLRAFFGARSRGLDALALAPLGGLVALREDTGSQIKYRGNPG
jgi:hypothetical protein